MRRPTSSLLLALLAVGACSSGGDDIVDPEGTIAITLGAPGGSIQQGGTATVGATLTRGGGFTGTVNLTVEGAPTGATASVSGVSTSGTTTTATVTVQVGAATPVGSYSMTVRGTASGLAPATAPFTLNVTAAPAGTYTLALTSSALSILQGGNSPTTTVNLTRTNFAASVTLSLDGAPAGVTGAFATNPLTGAGVSSVLTVTVGGAVAPGLYNLIVRGNAPGTGLPDRTAPLALTVTAAGSFTLSVTPAGGLSMVQGTVNNSKTININRTSYTAAVTLTAENLPTGLTAAFAPNGTTLNSSVLTLTAAAGVVPNVYSITIRGTGPAAIRLPGEVVSVEATTTIEVTVTAAVVGGFTLTTTPATSTSITQGTNGNVTVNINRTGGNTSSIALTATGTLPTGMSLSFNPTSTTTNSSVLTITTTGATPVGTTPIVIRGNTTGLGEQTIALTINVTAAGGSGNVTLNWSACGASAKAVFVAYQDGPAGPWVRATGVGDVYQFNISQSKGGYAYVTVNSGTGNPTISILLLTQAELSAGASIFCTSSPQILENLTGTVANLPVGFSATIGFASSTGIAVANGPFALNNARDGTFDLVAYAKAAAAGAGDRVFLDRGLNPVGGGSVGTVDFAHATKSFAPAVATGNLTGTVGGETVLQSMSFSSGTGPTACTSAGLYFSSPVTGNSFNAYAIPIGRQVAGDANLITLTSSPAGFGTFRSTSEYFTDLVARAANPFVLPAAAPIPTVTDAGGPYKRASAVINGIPAEYNTSTTITYAGQTARSGFISASGGWVAGPNVTLTLPDFSALTGWNNAWAPTTGEQVQVNFSVAGTSVVTNCAAGNRSVTAASGPFTI